MSDYLINTYYPRRNGAPILPGRGRLAARRGFAPYLRLHG